MQMFYDPVEIIETFENVHQYHISALSQSSDCENMISCDDTTVTLWNIERSCTKMNNQPRSSTFDYNYNSSPPKTTPNTTNSYFNLIDKAPRKIFELSEVITHCEFHPTDPCLFLLTSSKGYIEVYDLRESTKLKPTIKLQINDSESL